MPASLLLMNISELVTLDPLTKKSSKASIAQEDLGLLKEAWVFVKEGVVDSFGTGNSWQEKASAGVSLAGHSYSDTRDSDEDGFF